jgi:DMSO/TMAO reductase YedYZ molybdopterin-dependent catalytic subunit
MFRAYGSVVVLCVLLLVMAVPVSAQTTQLEIIKYQGDGTTVMNQSTVTTSWMEQNLPVMGDGKTPYIMQGPILDGSDKWNPAEDKNFDKVNETIKGTNIKDLCDLVGGMSPGDEIELTASDGYQVALPYDNVYTPQSRQGPAVLAWWNAGQQYSYSDGMRLFFMADTSVNPQGLHVFGHEDMKACFDTKYQHWYGGVGNYPSAAGFGNRDIAKIEIFTTPAKGWTLHLNGAISQDITKDAFEQGLSWSSHKTSYSDASGTWEGMPLWRLVGYVDDANSHIGTAYNDSLADAGYTISVIAGDGFTKNFTSQEIERNDNYIVANTLNGQPLPDQINGKNTWPLKLVGVNATGGKSVGSISEIRLTGIPAVTSPTTTPTTQPTTTTTATVTPAPSGSWSLSLSGAEDEQISDEYYAAGVACGGHSASYTDAQGRIWTGMPLWRIVGLVDDATTHDDLIGAYNDTLADAGYTVSVIAGDGYTQNFTSQEIKRSKGYILANTMNGTPLPMQINGKNTWPLKLIGTNATGGKSIGNVTMIKLTGLPASEPTPTPTANVTPQPTGSDGATTLFDGAVSLRTGTFNATAYTSGTMYSVDALTPQGALDAATRAAGLTYNVTDKKWATMGTMLLDGVGIYNKDSTHGWAYTLNGAAMNDFSSPQGISVYRLHDGDKLVFYYGATGGSVEGATAVIRITVHIPQQTVIYDGDVTLVSGNFSALAYNSGQMHTVNVLTPHGALEAASQPGGFTYNASDKKWSTLGTMLLDGIGQFPYNKTAGTSWAYQVNGVTMNDFSAAEGISTYPLKNGDRLTFFFGTSGGSPDNATAIVSIRVHISIDGAYSLKLNGTTTQVIDRQTFENAVAAGHVASYQDLSGTWQGIPLRYLAGLVDDTQADTFNETLASLGYSVKVSSGDGFNTTLQSGQIANSSDYIIANTLNGQPLADQQWPLRLVGAGIVPKTSVAKVATIDLIGIPSVTPTVTPIVIDGDQGWYTIHCNVDGATVIFDQTTKGTIAQGILKIQVYTTGTPYRTYTVQKDGYTTVSGAITDYPGKDQNVDIIANLTPASVQTPYNGPHNLPGKIEAEDYDLGGEGVGYHSTWTANPGGVYRNDGVGIEYNAWEKSNNVGWIRDGAWLAYTVSVGHASTYTLQARVSSPMAGRQINVAVDGQQAAVIGVPNTGDYDRFATVQTTITLPAGVHLLKVTFVGDGQNLNYMEFIDGVVQTPTPQPTAGTADFTASTTSGKKSLFIRFTDTTSGTPVAWKWEFTGGNAIPQVSTQRNPGVWFNEAHQYTVKLTVTEADGTTRTTTKNNYISVTW